jgi:hypothetical protein
VQRRNSEDKKIHQQTLPPQGRPMVSILAAEGLARIQNEKAAATLDTLV